MIYKNMSNKVKYSIIISCVIFLILMFVYGSYFAPATNCQKSQDFIKESYSGIVQNKVFDQKNNAGTFTITKNGKSRDLMIPNDSTFFSFIQIGDSLVKNQNQDFIEVHRSSITTNFKINFGCETSK